MDAFGSDAGSMFGIPKSSELIECCRGSLWSQRLSWHAEVLASALMSDSCLVLLRQSCVRFPVTGHKLLRLAKQQDRRRRCCAHVKYLLGHIMQ